MKSQLTVNAISLRYRSVSEKLDVLSACNQVVTMYNINRSQYHHRAPTQIYQVKGHACVESLIIISSHIYGA